MGLSNYSEESFVDAIVAGTSFNAGASLYLSLHTSSPGETGSSAEVSGNGYSRQLVTFNAGSRVGSYWTGTTSNSPTYTASGGSWGTISYVGIWDAASGGNFLSYDALDVNKTVPDGSTITFSSGDISARVYSSVGTFQGSSEYLAEKMYNAVLRNTTYSGESNYYLGLYVSSDTEFTSGSSPGYARPSVVLYEYSASVVRSTAANSDWTASGGDWQECISYSLHNASTGGDVLFFFTTTTFPLSILDGDIIRASTGDIRFSFA